MTIVKKEIINFSIGDSDDPDNPEQDIEETKFYTSDSYDENLNLIGYNSEMRDSTTGRIIAVIDFHENEQETRIRYCPHCEEFGIKNMLGALMIKNGNKNEDWEDWLQCHHCANIYARFEPMAHGKLNLPTEQHISENPHEVGNGIVMGAFPDRKSAAGRRLADKKRRKRTRHHDKDIQREIDKGLVVNILYDSTHP